MTSESIDDVEILEEEISAESPQKDQDSASYIEALRKENARFRMKAKENKEYAKKFADTDEKLKDTHQKLDLTLKQLNDMKHNSEKRIIDAELRAHAQEYGLKKLEYLKLGQLDSVKIDDNGNVVGAREMMEALKVSDPDLFQLKTSTNVDYNINRAEKVSIHEPAVLKMSAAEARKAEAEFLKSLRSSH